ncbi:SpoIID/LytB domain-containing protein [Patescibacteria group bacterium AH-259-L07]|nr:SpoIID/LytB domain-containing protein [Patescibacteria group bacterium AH-259-L07]
MKSNYLTKIVLGLFLTAFFVFPQIAFAQTGYAAQRISQSHAAIPELGATETIEFWVIFKNTGSQYWSGMGPEQVTLRTATGQQSKIAHTTWYNSYTPNRVNPALTIFPEDEALFRFTLLAPRQAGMYWQKFKLFAGSTKIEGGDIEVGIKVIEITTEAIEPTPTPEPTPEPTPAPAPTPEPEPEELWWQTINADVTIANNYKWQNLPLGPDIRVGLLYVEKPEKSTYLPFKISTLNNTLYDIYDRNGRLLVKNTEGEVIEVDYDYDIDRYFINNSNGKRLLMTDSYVTLRSDNNPIFKINNWQNGPFWDNDNTFDNEFRDQIEIHYNPNTERLWLINQLPFEEYLKGVAEVSDTSQYEFLKAQMVAARTYALFRYETPKYTNTPTGDPFFTVRSTQADQVYRGYQRELRAPNTVRAVSDTTGVAATYSNDPILAFYFAQSDGKTRSSYEAGMTSAPVAYLQSKSDPPSVGKPLRGHGVGLPQISGMTAASQGANYSQILKYYYTDIELTKMY